MSGPNANVSHTPLRDFITRCFVACGMPGPDAAKAAGLMAQADLIGQDGHGVFRLPRLSAFADGLSDNGLEFISRQQAFRSKPLCLDRCQH